MQELNINEKVFLTALNTVLQSIQEKVITVEEAAINGLCAYADRELLDGIRSYYYAADYIDKVFGEDNQYVYVLAGIRANHPGISEVAGALKWVDFWVDWACSTCLPKLSTEAMEEQDKIIVSAYRNRNQLIGD